MGLVAHAKDGRPGNSKTRTDFILPSRLARGSLQSSQRPYGPGWLRTVRKSDTLINKVDLKTDKTDSKIDNAVLIVIGVLFLQNGFNIWMKGDMDKGNNTTAVQ